MKRKNIDAAREARLWVGQIIIPLATAAMILGTNPDVKEKIKAIKTKIIK